MSEHQILERGKKTYSNLLQASSWQAVFCINCKNVP